MARILLEVDDWRGTAAGALYRRLFEGTSVERDEYERWVDALVKADLLSAVDETFEKDGREIRYRRLMRIRGSVVKMDQVRLAEGLSVRGKGKATRGGKAATGSGKVEKVAGKSRAKTRATRSAESEPTEHAANARVVERLRDWRLKQARSKRIPAFRVMTDRTLHAIATLLPETKEALLCVHGVGPKLADKYGAKILQLIREP
jgi:DNA topoisomerase-3